MDWCKPKKERIRKNERSLEINTQIKQIREKDGMDIFEDLIKMESWRKFWTGNQTENIQEGDKSRWG